MNTGCRNNSVNDRRALGHQVATKDHQPTSHIGHKQLNQILPKCKLRETTKNNKIMYVCKINY